MDINEFERHIRQEKESLDEWIEVAGVSDIL